MPRAVDIVVPVFNEEAYIDDFVSRVSALDYGDRLIFVDNASTDGTVARISRHPQVRLIRHARNQGYGASIRHGIEAGRAECIVIIDGDLEYPPESIPALLEALERHPVVYCSRFLDAGAPDMSAVRRVGNRTMSAVYNLLYRQQVTDLYTGMKGFRRDAFPLAALTRNGFEHAAEIATVIAFAGQRIHEIPVEYAPRQRGVSKMRHVPEVLKLGFYIVAYRLAGARRRGVTSRG
jgi:glycosyltransferase involved in cell wall biosynthesis